MSSPLKSFLAAEAAMSRAELRALSNTMFDDLRRLSGDGIGINRETYGAGEQAAMDYCVALAGAEGLASRFDEAANLIVELPGREEDAPVVICGSHLDSVPRGGNYDGAAGVFAGLLVLIRMKRAGITPERTIRAMALRGEESAWFGQCYLGSNALFGQLAADDLALPRRDTGKPLGEYMQDAGAEVARIAAGERFLEPASVAAYIELHIEQGPVMTARDLPVAVVTGLRGNIRHQKVLCRGEAGHSGAVPRWLRRDAVFATVELLSRFDEHWRVLLERGLDLVLTAGILHTDADTHAMSRIPGECSFSLEARSQSIDTLEAFYQLIRAEADAVADARKVSFEFDRRSLAHPAMMDDSWVKHLLRTCERLDLPAEAIPSGAGHDAAVFANAGVASAMIFVRNANGSHNPDEAMDLDDFVHGVNVLFHALLNPPL